MLEVRNEIHVFEGMLNYIRKRFVTSLYKGSASKGLPSKFLCKTKHSCFLLCVSSVF